MFIYLWMLSNTIMITKTYKIYNSKQMTIGMSDLTPKQRKSKISDVASYIQCVALSVILNIIEWNLFNWARNQSLLQTKSVKFLLFYKRAMNIVHLVSFILISLASNVFALEKVKFRQYHLTNLTSLFRKFINP